MTVEDKHKAAVTGVEYLAYRYLLRIYTEIKSGGAIAEAQPKAGTNECLSTLVQILTYEPRFSIPVKMKHGFEQVLNEARLK